MSDEAVPEAETEVEPAEAGNEPQTVEERAAAETAAQVAEAEAAAAAAASAVDRVCECVDDHGVSVRDDGSFCRRCGLRK